jgi:tetratricopeptide (TPR) repeat protein
VSAPATQRRRPKAAPTLQARQTLPSRASILPLAIIFIVALAIRLLHVWQIRRAPLFDVLIGDARAYDLWAQRIAAGDWIGSEVFYQAPLYAYFLGLVYTIAGHDPMVVRVCQAVLGSAACVLLADAGSRLLSRPVGIAAGFMLAVYAPAIFFDGLIQKAALDLVLLALMIWIIARWLIERPERRAPWVWLGITAGALSLSRENALAFVVVLVVWAATGAGRVTRGSLARAGLVLAGLGLVLVPVAARNAAIGGGVYITTSQFGPNFYIGNNPAATGGYDPLRPGRGGAQYEREDATALAERAAGRPLSPAEVSRYWTGRAFTFIREQPGAWLRLMVTKAGLLVNATEIMDTESQDAYEEVSAPLAATAWFAHFGVLVPLALVGMVVTWRDRRPVGVLLAMTGVYAASVVIFYVFARYRYPLVPFLVLFGAAGLVGLPRFLSEAPRPVALTSVALAAGLALVVNRPIVDPDLTRAVTASNLGQALWADGRRDEAIAQYQRAVALQPAWAPAYFSLGNALREAGRPAEALTALERAVALDPTHARARYSLGTTLVTLGRPREAIEQLRQAVAALPEFADAHRALGIALATDGRLADARQAFATAVRLAPDSAEAHNDLGVALARAGELAAAVEHFERALALEPDFAEARRNLEAAGKTRQ